MGGQRGGVFRRKEQASVGQGARQGGGIGGDHRLATGHRLDHRHAKALVNAGHNKYIAQSVVVGDAAAVFRASEDHRIGHAQLGGAGLGLTNILSIGVGGIAHQQQHRGGVLGLDSGQRLDQIVNALVAGHAPDIQQHALIGQAILLDQGWVGRAGVGHSLNHRVGLHADPASGDAAGGNQLIGGELAMANGVVGEAHQANMLHAAHKILVAGAFDAPNMRRGDAMVVKEHRRSAHLADQFGQIVVGRVVYNHHRRVVEEIDRPLSARVGILELIARDREHCPAQIARQAIVDKFGEQQRLVAPRAQGHDLGQHMAANRIVG